MTESSPCRKNKRITCTASLHGVEKAEKALLRLGFGSKSNFAKSHHLSRTTVTKFFQRQPIQLNSLKTICELLTLDWKEIAGIIEGPSEQLKIKDCITPVTFEEEGQVQIIKETSLQVTVIDKKNSEIKAVITLKGDIKSFQNSEAILSILQIYSGDTITITDIQEGSIKLFIKGSQEDIGKLISLIKSGELRELNGFPVEDIQVNDKWCIVQEIVERPVKGRNLSGFDLSDADLSGADLRKADLSGAHLSDVDLSGANLSGANLRNADLSGADLSNADLSGADLSGADLSDADLRNVQFAKTKFKFGQLFLNLINLFSRIKVACCIAIKGDNRGVIYQRKVCSGLADLSRANLSRTNLCCTNLSRVKLTQANLSEANLINAKFKLADLSFANLSGADLCMADLCQANMNLTNLSNAEIRGANLSGAKLRGANLSEAKLNGANLSSADLRRANLVKSDLIEVKLSKANLSRAELNGANLSDAEIRGANLSGAILIGAYLSSADLSRSNLSGADLNNANLRKVCLRLANLSQANLHRSDLNEANLSGADLRGADIRGADLTVARQSLIFGNANVKGAKFAWNRGLCPNDESRLKRLGALFPHSYFH